MCVGLPVLYYSGYCIPTENTQAASVPHTKHYKILCNSYSVSAQVLTKAMLSLSIPVYKCIYSIKDFCDANKIITVPDLIMLF